MPLFAFFQSRLTRMQLKLYATTAMSKLRGIFFLRLIAGAVFLCLYGQGFIVEWEHFGLIHLDSHFVGHADESNVPDGERSEPTGHHHHLADIIFPRLENTSSPSASTSSFLVLAELYDEGPVFGIDHPPQLS